MHLFIGGNALELPLFFLNPSPSQFWRHNNAGFLTYHRQRLNACFPAWLHDVDRLSALTNIFHRADRNKMLQQSTSLFTVAAQQVSYLAWSYFPAALDSVDNRPKIFARNCHTLRPAFMCSYLALRSSAGVGPLGETGAASARRTGGIGFPANTRFSHISRTLTASRSSS